MDFMFEKLEVYQRAVDFAEEIFKLTDELPRGQAAVSDQFKRAVLSISLNIAEGNGRWHSKERKNFFLLSRPATTELRIKNGNGSRDTAPSPSPLPPTWGRGQRREEHVGSPIMTNPGTG